MPRPILITLTAAPCIALLAATGCLRRSETITVHRDGGVSMTLEYEGDPGDFVGGDAMPSAATGWTITQRYETDDKGNENVILSAGRDFAPGEALADSYADPAAPDADLFTRFPTTLSIERRRDGTYYHFQRTYLPRRWAYVEYWQRQFIDDHVRQISDKPIEEMTRLDQIQVIQALVATEAHKQIGFARSALAACEPDLPQDQWLIARRALLRSYADDRLTVGRGELQIFTDGDTYVTHVDPIIDRCGALSGEQRDACLAEEAQRVLNNGYQAMIGSLRTSGGLDTASISAFERAYGRAKTEYDITDALAGQHFEICVAMPGVIVAHNAEKEADNGKVCWEFGGDAVRDRPMELAVSSRVDAGEPNN